MPWKQTCPSLLCWLLLLPFAPALHAQPGDGIMLTNEIRSTRARLESQQRTLTPRQLDELAYVLGRSNYLARAIETAAAGNNLPRTEQLLKEFPGTVDDVLPYPGMGTLLYRAAENGSEEWLTFLLAHRANPNRPGRQGEMPLIAAMRFQHWPSALRLLEAGAQAAATNAQGQSALELLLQNYGWGSLPGADPRSELLTALLAHGADPFGPAKYSPGASVIEFALQRNWQSDLPNDLLLTNQPNPSHRTVSGQTALHLAALCGRTNALEFLFTHGFSPNQTNDSGLTPLQLLTDSTPPGALRANSVRGRTPPLILPSGPGWGISLPGLRPAPPPAVMADFLLSHGAILDLFSAAGLGRTNDLAALLATNAAAANARDGCGRTPLHYAASSLQLETARLLLRSGATPSVASSKPVPQHGLEASLPAGLTPLHLAALRTHAEMVRLLLQAGAPTSPQDEPGDTPLHLAARGAQTNIVGLLLAAHASLDVTNQNGQTPLYLAATSGSGANLELLLQAGANPAFGFRTNTLVHVAALHGNVQALTLLLRHGLPVDAPDADGHTPLEQALTSHAWDVLNLLRSKGAKLNTQDLHGNTPLHLAVTMQDDSAWHMSEQSLWVKWKQDWLAGGGWRQQTLTKFIQWKLVAAPAAPIWTNTSLTAWLLQHGAKPNLTNQAGQTPLHVLCGQPWMPYAANFSANVPITNRLTALLHAGARVELHDATGLTCLHVAATNTPPELLTLLTRQVPHPETLRDAQGRTALHYALHFQNFGPTEPAARVRALFAAGFPPDTPDNQGRTPLHEVIASFSDNSGWQREGLLLSLLTNRANPNVQDARGLTPLHLAMQNVVADSSYGLRAACQLLLSNHAELNLPDRQGRTPLHLLTGTNIPWAHPAGRVDNLLLSYPWDFAARDRTGQTPIHLWCANLDTSCSACGELLRTVLTNRSLANLTNGAGDTPLHVAIRAGRTYTVPILLRAGANPARRNARGETAYRLAVEKWDPSGGPMPPELRPPGANNTFFQSLFFRDRRCFDLWLEADPSLCSVTNAEHQTPLQVASAHGLTDWVDRLLELGAPVDLLSALRLDYMNDFRKLLAQHHGPVPAAWLFEAVHYKRSEALQALVAAGGDVHATDDAGHSLAYYALDARLPELEDWLRTKGCRDTLFDAVAREDRDQLEKFFAAAPQAINATNGQGRTPLLTALANGQAALVDFLLGHGANVHSRTREGWSALHLAVAGNQLAAGQLLLKAGADPNQLAPSGMGPLHLAAALGHNQFAELLLANGADVNLCPPGDPGQFRNSPLHWAAHRGGVDTVKLLLAHGADPKATNGQGATPAALAEGSRHGQLLWFYTPPGIPNLRPRMFPKAEVDEIMELLKEAEARADKPAKPAPGA